MAAAASAASAAAARISGALSDAQYFESGMIRVEDIRRLLDSRSLKHKLDAMKRVVALISLGRDASLFFPDVVKNVVAPSLDVKKLVYLYLVHYAEDKQDLALLSINSFQKDISDHNEIIRALALRVLSSIRVKVILQIVILAITKCAKDPSPYVRKAAAHAIAKVCSLDNPSREILMESLSLLLNDRSLEVMGAAVAVLDEVAPDNFDLIHPHYRHICRSLSDMDPCGQVAVLRVLLRYSRIHFAAPRNPSNPSERDDDLSFLLEAAHPLLASRESRVVVAAVAIYMHLASRSEILPSVVRPVMRLILSSEPGVQYVALRCAADVLALEPGALLTYVPELLVWDSDCLSVRDAKISLLTRMCEQAAAPTGLGSNIEALHLLLSEFKSYMYRPDKALAAAATRALGQLAASHPPSASTVIRMLASVVAQSTDVVVVSESVTVLRRLLQLHPTAKAHALPRLISLLLIPPSEGKAIAAAEARAAIVWLIGEFYETIPNVAPEALRILARGFLSERTEVKLQILNLAAKVVAWDKFGLGDASRDAPGVSSETRLNLLSYVTSCGAIDTDYDVRDKARTLRHLFLTNAYHKFGPQLGRMLFRKEGKASGFQQDEKAGMTSENFAIDAAEGQKGGSRVAIVGSFSHVLGKHIAGCRPLPPWADQNSPSSLRNEDPPDLRTGANPIDVTSVSSSSYHANGYPVSSSSGFSSAVVPSLASGKQSRHSTLAMYRPRAGAQAENFYDSEPENEESSDGSYETDTETGSDASSHAEESGKAETSRSIMESPLDMLGIGSQNTPTTSALSNVTPAGGTSATSRVTDLFAALARSGSNPLVADEGVPSGSGGQVTRDWQSVVNGVNSDGLELKVAFLRGSFFGGPDATPMVFLVSNFGRANRSGVALQSKAVFFKTTGTNIHAVPPLDPGSSIEIECYCMFGGKVASVEVQVRIGEEAVASGMVRPTPGHILRPLPSITITDFVAKEKELSGMLGCKLTFSSSDKQANLASLRSQVQNTASLAEIVPGSLHSASPAASLRFAGFLPSAEEKQGGVPRRRNVLVHIEAQSSGTATGASGSIWVGCENVVYANTLGHLLKAALST